MTTRTPATYSESSESRWSRTFSINRWRRFTRFVSSVVHRMETRTTATPGSAAQPIKKQSPATATAVWSGAAQSWWPKVKRRHSVRASVAMRFTHSPTENFAPKTSTVRALRKTAAQAAAWTLSPTFLPRIMRCVSQTPRPTGARPSSASPSHTDRGVAAGAVPAAPRLPRKASSAWMASDGANWKQTAPSWKAAAVQNSQGASAGPSQNADAGASSKAPSKARRHAAAPASGATGGTSHPDSWYRFGAAPLSTTGVK